MHYGYEIKFLNITCRYSEVRVEIKNVLEYNF